MTAKKKGSAKRRYPMTLQMVADRVGLTKGTCSAVLNQSEAPGRFRHGRKNESSKLLAS